MFFVVCYQVGIFYRQAYLIKNLVGWIWKFFIRECSTWYYPICLKISDNGRGNVFRNSKDRKIKYILIFLQYFFTYQWLDDSREYQ